MQKFFLAANLGNTHLSLGIFSDVKIITQQSIAIRNEWQRQFASFVEPYAIYATAFCSVNPLLEDKWRHAIENNFALRAKKIGTDIPLAIPIKVRKPEQVGMDRLVIAAQAWRQLHSKCLVIDLGTAMTLNAVSAQGEFLGGAIAPGACLSAQALQQGTAQLPVITPSSAKKILGQETEEAIHAGIHFSVLGTISKWIEQGKQELGSDCQVIATGGDAQRIQGLQQIDHFIPNLLLQGIHALAV